MAEATDDEYLTRREAEVLLAAGRAATDEAKEVHRHEHEAEKNALQTALTVADREWKQHGEAHDREHERHAEEHEAEKAAVRTALDAVARERQIHATAHEREHIAHEKVHDLNQQAVDKAEVSVDKRLGQMNAFREENRTDKQNFASIEVVGAMQSAIDRRFADTTKHTDERYEENRRRIEMLEKGDVGTASKAEGRSMGQGAVVAIIVGAVGFVGTVLGIIIVLANLITG